MGTSLVYRSAAGYELVMRALYGRHYGARIRVVAEQVPDFPRQGPPPLKLPKFLVQALPHGKQLSVGGWTRTVTPHAAAAGQLAIGEPRDEFRPQRGLVL